MKTPSHRGIPLAITAGLVTLAVTMTPAISENRVIETEQTTEPEWHRKAMETREARIAWWREARFGMFIHWGVYSTLSGEWQGKPYGGYAEHIQRRAKIPIATYRKEVAGVFHLFEVLHLLAKLFDCHLHFDRNVGQLKGRRLGTEGIRFAQ